MPSARPKKESPLHKQAFEEYFWMRPRSYRVVAKKLHKTIMTIQVWAHTFNWEKRIEQRENELYKRIREENDSSYIKARSKQIEIAEAVLERFYIRLSTNEKKLAKNKATAYEPNAADAHRWASHQVLLMGAATSRTEVGLTKGVVAGLMAAITAVIRRIIPSVCPHCKTHLGLPEKVASALRDVSKRFSLESKPAGTPGTAAKQASSPSDIPLGALSAAGGGDPDPDPDPGHTPRDAG